MNSLEKWRTAQAHELACWQGIAGKLHSPEYLDLKREYWRRIVAKAGITPEELDRLRILEVGCGPSGIFLLCQGAGINFTLLDPLVNDYQNLVPGVLDRFPKVASPFEGWNDAEPQNFDLIFAVNCIDHSEDLTLFVKKLYEKVAPNGRVVIGVNTHRKRWSARVWSLFQFFLEPHHPFHFTDQDYRERFETRFEIVKAAEMESEVIWINNQTAQLGELRPKRSMIPHPRTLLFRVMGAFGLPLHDFKGQGNSLYEHMLYVLKPASKSPLKS